MKLMKNPDNITSITRAHPVHAPGSPVQEYNRKRSWPRLMAMILLPLIFLAAGGAGYVQLMKTKKQTKSKPAAERAWVVQTQKAAFTRLQPEMRLYGEVVAGKKVDMRTLAAGEIVAVGPSLREGAAVAKGDELIRIDTFDYQVALDEAKARLAEAKARLEEIKATIRLEESAARNIKEQLDIAKRDFDRAAKLKESRTLAQNTVDARRLIVSQREQALQQRKDNVLVQKARAAQQEAVIQRLRTQIAKAERNLKNTVLKAPFDGYVSRVSAEVGRFVGVNDLITTLIARDNVDVRFTLSDRQYGRILAEEGTVIGRKVKIAWQVGGNPLIYDGVIERVGAEISATTGGVAVIARIMGTPENLRSLRPGAFVEVLMKDRAYDKVIRLPESAVFGTDTLYVVKENRLKRREIEIVGHAGSSILVRGAVENGDSILTTRLAVAGNDLLVEVNNP